MVKVFPILKKKIITHFYQGKSHSTSKPGQCGHKPLMVVLALRKNCGIMFIYYWNEKALMVWPHKQPTSLQTK